MNTSSLRLTALIAGLLVLAFFGLIMVGAAYHFGMVALFARLGRPSDELRTAVRTFYDQNDRVPANVQELGVHAVSNGLPFDALAYGTVTFVPSNDYIRVEYKKKWTSGQCYVYLQDDAESRSFDNHGSLRGLVANFHLVHERLPRSMQELQEHIQEHRLDFDMTPYKSIRVRKKLFGRVHIAYVMKPQGPRSSSGSMQFGMSELSKWTIEQDEATLPSEAAPSASSDDR